MDGYPSFCDYLLLTLKALKAKAEVFLLSFNIARNSSRVSNRLDYVFWRSFVLH